MKRIKQTVKIKLLSFSLIGTSFLRAVGVCVLLLIGTRGFSQSVAINATGASADASALLDLSAANKGFLITRSDTASITLPAFGLMTLAPLDSCLYMYSGVNWISLGGVGTTCNSSTPSPPPFPPGSVFCTGLPTVVNDVTSSTGAIWMDRNLGASQVATASADAASYGDLYQWGRFTDGHQCRTSTTVATQSTSDTPGHGDFIVGFPDWRNPLNNTLWQGVAGINNPCPSGYRIPTEAELETERLSWSSNNSAGAFASPLKLSVGGFRFNNGSLFGVGGTGYYWSSTITGSDGRVLSFSTSAIMSTSNRSPGMAVRCIKN